MEIHKSKKKSWVRGPPLGSGSHATVFLAMSAHKAKIMAVKTASEGTTEAMYLHSELDILKQMQSPYVVECFGGESTIEDGVELFNVMMEYMPLGTVSDLVRSFGGKFSESAIRSYTRCLLLGLQRIHELGFIHGDVKGKNVLVNCDGTAKLADFGCSKRISASSSSDDGKSLCGTPLWMAPEVITLQQQRPASDIWSLGCTVVEMTSGKAPWSELFDDKRVVNGMEAMFRIAMRNDVPEFQGLKVSSELKDFLSKCLVRDVSKRWTCEELLAHPFISQEGTPPSACSSPTSPTCVLDFDRTVSDCSTSSLDSNIKEDDALKDRFQRLAIGFDMGRCAQKKSGNLFDEMDAQWIEVEKRPFTPSPAVLVEAATSSLKKQPLRMNP